MDLFINKEAILGHGAFSVVYKGLYVTKCVAVKSVPLARIDEAKVKPEELTLLRLNHTNVTRLFFVDQCDLFKYFIFYFMVTFGVLTNCQNFIDTMHMSSATYLWISVSRGKMMIQNIEAFCLYTRTFGTI